jgi:hypothetical protein
MKHVEQPDRFRTTDRRGQDHSGAEPVGAVEVLEHRFVDCVCGRHQYMLAAGETPLTKCPQEDWTWTPHYGIGYGPYGRDDGRRQLSPEDQ